MKITEMPLDARPREKAMVYGIDTLSNEELLAILIQSGYKNESALDIAKKIIDDNPSLTSLCSLTVEELGSYKGIKQAGALKIATAFQIAKRLSNEMFIDSSTSGLEPLDIKKKYQLELGSATQEHIILVLLNRKDKLIKEKRLALGGRDFANLDLKVLLKTLLSTTCHSFYLLHNHPDGTYNPSEQDLLMTYKIINECKKYDVILKDHLVFFQNGCYSIGQSKLIK